MQTNKQEQQQETMPTYSPVPLQDAIAAPALNPLGSATGLNAPLDAYLDAICAKMPAEVPADTLADMRREMRGHLEAAIVAHCELGQDEAEAIQSALAQFGLPQTVAQRWRQEWLETLAETKPLSVWPSLKTALKMWAAVDIGALALITVFFTLILYRPQTPSDDTLHALLLPVLFLIMPLLAGTVIGLRARRHPLLCTLGGNLLLSPVFAICLMGVNGLSHFYGSWLTGKPNHSTLGVEFINGIHGMLSLLPMWIFFSLISCGVVVIGQHIKKRARRRQIAR